MEAEASVASFNRGPALSDWSSFLVAAGPVDGPMDGPTVGPIEGPMDGPITGPIDRFRLASVAASSELLARPMDGPIMGLLRLACSLGGGSVGPRAGPFFLAAAVAAVSALLLIGTRVSAITPFSIHVASYSCSMRIKAGIGSALSLRRLTVTTAWCNVMCTHFMRYNSTAVVDRDTPRWQCTKTLP